MSSYRCVLAIFSLIPHVLLSILFGFLSSVIFAYLFVRLFICLNSLFLLVLPGLRLRRTLFLLVDPLGIGRCKRPNAFL